MPEEVRALYRFVDWLVRLPENLDIQFEREIAAFEEEHSMTYVTGIERRAIEKGLRKGREEGLQKGLQLARDGVVEVLEARFDAVPAEIAAAIQRVEDADAFLSLLRSALHGETLREFQEHLDAVLQR